MTTDELVLPRTRNRSGGARCNLTFEVAVDQYEWLQAEADFSVSDRVQSALESGPVAHDPTAPTRTRGDQTKMITTWLRPPAHPAGARPSGWFAPPAAVASCPKAYPGPRVGWSGRSPQDPRRPGTLAVTQDIGGRTRGGLTRGPWPSVVPTPVPSALTLRPLPPSSRRP